MPKEERARERDLGIQGPAAQQEQDQSRDQAALQMARQQKLVMRKAAREGAQGPDAAAKVSQASRGGGEAVDASVRRKVEATTGADLSAARVHTGSESERAASSVGAKAYTTGQDIHFAAGQYQPGTAAGDQLLAHELVHTAQQQAGGNEARQNKLEVSQSGDHAEHEADAIADKALAGSGDRQAVTAAQPAVQRKEATPKDPREFPTYEEWMAAFKSLPAFSDSIGFDVLGDQAADDKNPAAPEEHPKDGERFINHPSLKWLQDNLPQELQNSVYLLPADCADTAILLRHVWLYAHGRTEKYGTWTIGVGAGATDQTREGNLKQLITQNVYSGSVKAMVSSAYTDEAGKQLRSFPALEPMLHPGDILVWEHHAGDGKTRIGGHTQTIQTIDRDEQGKVTSITALQGNQPLGPSEAAQIQEQQKKDGKKPESEEELRALPGRRIERGSLSGSELTDSDGVWCWNDPDHTTLIAAGPPAGASRPAAKRDPKTKQPKREISDWYSALKTSTAGTLTGTFEASLYEARAAVEGGHETIDEKTANQLGAVAGQRALQLGAPGKALLPDMEAEINSMGSHPATPTVGDQLKKIFDAIAAGLKTATQPKAKDDPKQARAQAATGDDEEETA